MMNRELDVPLVCPCCHPTCKPVGWPHPTLWLWALATTKSRCGNWSWPERPTLFNSLVDNAVIFISWQNRYAREDRGLFKQGARPRVCLHATWSLACSSSHPPFHLAFLRKGKRGRHMREAASPRLACCCAFMSSSFGRAHHYTRPRTQNHHHLL